MYDGNKSFSNCRKTSPEAIFPPFEKQRGDRFSIPPSASLTALAVSKGGLSLAYAILQIEKIFLSFRDFPMGVRF